MTNPFEIIDKRLSNIESLLLDLKHRNPENQDPISPKKYFSVKEASAYLGLAVPTLYSIISRGEISSIKKGKRVYFLLNDLDHYLESGRRKSNMDVQQSALYALRPKRKGGAK